MKSLKYIFKPKSVAVIGASATIGTVGNAIFSNILQSSFRGEVYPVNPKHSNIMSVRAYKNILSVPAAIDLAVVCVPKDVVENVIKQCAEKRVKGIVIITAGFKEMGEVGKRSEDKIIAHARKHRIALIGPNCLGIINTDKNISLNANFALGMPNASFSVSSLTRESGLGACSMRVNNW